MKQLLLITLALITLVSCNNDPKDYVVLSGKIKNYRKKSFTIRGFGFEKKIKFDRRKKTFRDTLRGLKPGHYNLWIRKAPIEIYLDSAKDLTINVDAKRRTKSPRYGGENTELININKYLVKKLKKHHKILGNINKLFSYDEKIFIKKMKRYSKYMNKLLKKSRLPEDYTRKEFRNIKHVFIRNLNNYENYHGVITGNEDFIATDMIKKYIQEIDLNNSEDYKFSFNYRKLLDEFLYKLVLEIMPEDGDIDLHQIEMINEKIDNQFIKDELLFTHAKNNISYVEDLVPFYQKVTENLESTEYNEEITELFDKLKLTAKGEPSPKFNDFLNQEGGTTSLDDLIGKGKYLYIDIWASWCGFCKKEIPLLKNFEDKYHGKNVQFVSINVNNKSDLKLWKKNLKDKEMGGIQLFAGKEYEDLEFAQKYLIAGLPRFILLDPEGNIISPNAPRPSNGYKLDELFEENGIGKTIESNE